MSRLAGLLDGRHAKMPAWQLMTVVCSMVLSACFALRSAAGLPRIWHVWHRTQQRRCELIRGAPTLRFPVGECTHSSAAAEHLAALANEASGKPGERGTDSDTSKASLRSRMTIQTAFSAAACWLPVRRIGCFLLQRTGGLLAERLNLLLHLLAGESQVCRFCSARFCEQLPFRLLSISHLRTSGIKRALRPSGLAVILLPGFL